MIKSWKNSASRRLWHDPPVSKFRGLDADLAVERLALLNVARSLREITPLKSIGLHALKGNRKGQWAVSVNGPWRICFRFKDGDVFDVEVVNYH